ncbi:NF-kappa-B inhibitor delta [Engraulis encrasicolus]|uniref:NF-kappa-B inhibitor delta n=1 Tax=Engraulis encrasicolus TaxID=184585 RepID=UPI002FCED6E7
MLWPKSPKEKPCYPQPTVKKLLEQKRKRESSSLPACSLVPSSRAPTAHVSTLAPVEHSSAATGSGFSSMGAVGCETWDPALHSSPSTSSLHHHHHHHHSSSSLSPMGMSTSYLSSSSLTTVPMYSHVQPAPVSSYTQLPLQDLCTTSMMTQPFPECHVTMAPSMVHPNPIDWVTGPRQTGAILAPSSSSPSSSSSASESFGRPLDMRVLEEARRFIQGMDYGTTTWQDDDGDTILHIYTAKGQREYAYAAAEKLKEHGKLDSKEHKGKTALLVAVTAKQPGIVYDLIRLGADVCVCDVKGQTALHLAATYGYPIVMQVILSNAMQVDLEARNFEGLTPLHCAAISHSATMKAMAAASTFPSSTSTTTTTAAAWQGELTNKHHCLELLLSNGASALSQEIKSNKTVLHLAVKEGNIQLVRYLLSVRQADMQAIINMKAHGHTALHMAAGLHSSPHQEELIRLLLQHGADPSTRNMENDQPAHLLQSGDTGDKLKLILKKRGTSSRRRITSLQDQD